MQEARDFNQPTGTGALLVPEDDPAQMPLGLDDPAFGSNATGGDLAASGASRSYGGLLLVAVLLVAAGTLLAMKKTGGVEANDASLADAELKIEQALHRLTGKTSNQAAVTRQHLDAIFAETEQVIALFADDPTERQIDLGNVQKNPFELVLVRRKTDRPNDPGVVAIDKIKQQRLSELKKELEGYKLQSILQGKVALAVVNGKVIREGDAVGSFAVTSISPHGVRLAAEGNIYTLTMKKPEAN